MQHTFIGGHVAQYIHLKVRQALAHAVCMYSRTKTKILYISYLHPLLVFSVWLCFVAGYRQKTLL